MLARGLFRDWSAFLNHRVAAHGLYRLIKAHERAQGAEALGDQAGGHVGEAAGVFGRPAAIQGRDEAGAEGVAAAGRVLRL